VAIGIPFDRVVSGKEESLAVISPMSFVQEFLLIWTESVRENGESNFGW
jgi:hypothetical protein